MSGFWVITGACLPCGAHALGDSDHDGVIWMDVCILGQHLPQMYPVAEIHELTADGCARLGLCPECTGFGDTSPVAASDLLEAARSIDEIPPDRLCMNCGGSGRPAIRVTVTRPGGGIQGSLRPLPHEYVPPLEGSDPVLRAAFGVPDDMCLACGMPQDGKGPRDETLHVHAGE